MERKDLIITVAGQNGSGKSRLTYLLKKFLRENAFDVEFEGNLDHPTEKHFDKYISRNFDEVINNIKEKRKIRIKEIQLGFRMSDVKEYLRKAYEIGRSDARISEREGKYYDRFDDFFFNT
ncbi:MAG: hypothetical protein ACOCVF_00820 [bacterium]